MKFRIEKQIEYVLGENQELDRRVVYSLVRERESKLFAWTIRKWEQLDNKELKFTNVAGEYTVIWPSPSYGISVNMLEQEADKAFIVYYTNYAKSYAKIHSEGATVELMLAMEY